MHETLLPPAHITRDKDFDSLYPPRMQQLSAKHWTPIHIAALAARFLADRPGSHILDIGSGIGKFCLVAAQHYPDCHFWGIEQRKELVRLAEKAQKRIGVENVTFIHGSFTQLDLSRFDHFYFYNSFYENLVDEEFHIDASIDYSLSLYEYYTHSLFEALANRPDGTKLATYHSFREIVPPSYGLVESPHNTNDFLKYWIKK